MGAADGEVSAGPASPPAPSHTAAVKSSSSWWRRADILGLDAANSPPTPFGSGLIAIVSRAMDLRTEEHPVALFFQKLPVDMMSMMSETPMEGLSFHGQKTTVLNRAALR